MPHENVVSSPSLTGPEDARNTRDWSALLSRSLMRFDVESESPMEFRGSLRSRSIAGIDFIEMHTGRHTSHRGSASISGEDRADYMLCLQVTGFGEFIQNGRAAVLRPGDITLFDTSKPATVSSSENYRSLCMKFPHQVLDVAPAHMNELTATRFVADEGMTPAAGAVLTTLNRVADSLSGRSRYLAAHNALDLMTTIFQNRLGVTGDPQANDRHALLEQMEDFIERRLSNPDLSPGMIAEAHFVSLRQVHSVFHGAGLTVSSRIHGRRLDRCRRDLTDPAQLSVPVAVIGLRWGFKTASHFGLAFKKCYGRTPAEYRHDTISA